MVHDSDDELGPPPPHHQTESSSSSNFVNSFDDAFEDIEDNDVSFEFSPAAIRAELAKSLNNTAVDLSTRHDDELGSLTARIGFSDPDASAPTFGIGKHTTGEHVQLSPPTQQPPSSGSHTPQLSPVETFDDVNLTNEFTSIALDSPETDIHREVPPVERIVVEEEIPEHEEQAQHADYPSVQIDVSKEHPVATVIHVEPPSEDAAHSRSPSSTSQEQHPPDSVASAVTLPITPQSGSSVASTGSLPMPSPNSSAPPSAPPTTAHEASASHPSFFTHRSTKSHQGPSMLDKVVSKTRPTYLPPKPRTEDRKHMQDWEKMMKRSRAAGEYAWGSASRTIHNS